ncbi:MAG: nitroreductase [Spirochaetaceae bacterium]|nr:MAG: nitroreductase [Spirochaetaceae bacterium]
MTVYEAIRTRKSVRGFTDKPVEGDKLQRILEAARLAPSARNLQEWRILVVTDAHKRQALANAAGGQAFVGEAPVVLVCCAETNHHVMHCGIKSYPIDVAIAIDHMTLAAVEEGLGTCWIGKFDPAAVRTVCGIPPEIEVVQLLPLGYAADPRVAEKTRKPIGEIVHYEQWRPGLPS